MLHADHALAARLEGLAALELRRFVEAARAVEPTAGAEAIEVGGGVAAFVAPASPVNQALSLGMSGPVSRFDLERVERFFLERDARPLISVCPLAHPTLSMELAARGWVVETFENVLVRPYVSSEAFEPPAEGVEVVEAISEEDQHTWAIVAATGFSDPLPPLPEQLHLGAVVASRPGARLFLAMVDGHPAGTGEMVVNGDVAWLSADATLPHFRGRGVQQSLQRHRLRIGAEAGCELAVSEANPGSTSQRNQERAGFCVAYTRFDLVHQGSGDPATRKEGAL